jgi:repressor LexA
LYQLPTCAQLRILRVIHDFQEAHRYPPTVRQILAALGLNSTGSMAWHLRRMQEQGFLAERSSTRECWQIRVEPAQCESDPSKEDWFQLGS